MPRPGPRRPLVAVRMSDEGIAYLDKLAVREGVSRSEMIRILLKEAITRRREQWPAKYMPKEE